MPEKWQVLSSEEVFSSPWIKLRREAVRLPSGLELDDYYLVEQPDFVKVFAWTEEGHVVFIREYKHGAGEVVLQLPGGFAEPGEDPREAAERELREETGYAAELRKVAELVVDPTRSRTIEHVFVGPAKQAGPQRLDHSEDVEVVLVPAADLRPLITSGDLRVASTVASVFLCLPHLGI
ncbi:MAG TPA: NUDIX hydrolase [Chloroflexota bacterium]